MISNYSELVQAIYKWLVKDSNDPYYNSAMIDNIIYLAETELSRRLRVRKMRDTAILTTAAGINAVTLPTGFKQVYSAYYNTANTPQELEYASPAVFARNNLYQGKGQPRYYYIDSGSMVLGVTPDAEYEFTLDYYKSIPNLSSTNTTNDILTDYPDMYLFACLKQAFIASQDSEREGQYEARLDKLVMEATKEDKQSINTNGLRGKARSII